MKRGCPLLQGESSQRLAQSTLPLTLMMIQPICQFPTKPNKGSGGERGQEGRNQSQPSKGQAMVFALTPQDA